MSWKIKYLKLVNFIQIYSGMGKNYIELDLSNNDNMVSIFVGKMGSGKSSVLGHLQPYSTYGTLDVRNQESSILQGEDGLKEIIFQKYNDIYHITHNYTWNKNQKTHNTKSYITLNGEELNENGNIRSFKEIVKIHFGIDQNFLRLLRLGPNVANLINMKSTERKTFIASLLRDTEVYTMLHQKFSEEYRNINSALGLLNSKLQGYDTDKIQGIEIELQNCTEDLQKISRQMDAHKDEYSVTKAECFRLLNGETISSLLQYKGELNKRLHDTRINADKIKGIIDNFSNEEYNIDVVRDSIAMLSGELLAIESQIPIIESEIERGQSELDRLNQQIILKSDNIQYKELLSSVDIIQREYEEIKLKISDFNCTYGYQYLVNFNDVIQHFQLLLNEMCGYSQKLITKLYKASNESEKSMKKKLEILEATKIKRQREISNIKFSATYESPEGLERGKDCTDTQCPYFITHPDTMKKANYGIIDSEILRHQSEADKLISEINEVEEFISAYPRMQLLKKSWTSVSSVLSSIGALKERDLMDILINFSARNDWYSYETFVSVLEKSSLKEKFNEIQMKYLNLKNDLAASDATEIDKLKSEYEFKLDEWNKKMSTLSSYLNSSNEIKDKRQAQYEIQDTLDKKDTIRLEYEEYCIKLDDEMSKLQKLEETISIVSSHREVLTQLEEDIKALQMNYNKVQDKISTLRVEQSELKSANDSYNEYIKDRDAVRHIINAVSAKDGIPLVMIKLFLDNCKDIVNDLIEDVFDNDLEILDFRISEDTNEFKIPFSSGGVEVSDIEYASQGQQAVISLALSFALVRKSMFDYNILLLDEMDNSIYKADREKFLNVLMRQMEAMNTQQVFLITHNDIFHERKVPMNIITTSDELVEPTIFQTVYNL